MTTGPGKLPMFPTEATTPSLREVDSILDKLRIVAVE
jgi:hypothetical protein